MSLLFSSGGGRLGNQILNIIHLIALSNEYKIKIEKINDSFIESNTGNFKFPIGNEVNWQIVEKRKEKLFLKIFFKIYIILIHASYFLLPFFKSYLIGESNNRPRFLLGKKIDNDFKITKIMLEATNTNIIISGWGLRDWDLVLKYKKLIVDDLKKIFNNLKVTKNILTDNRYIFVHIRRGDFLEVENLKQINFSNSIWIKAIKELCFKTSINQVVIFSDSEIPKMILRDLKKSRINVINPIQTYENFLLNFVRYISDAFVVLCNASTLTLSLSFLYHEEIYLPSGKNNYLQKVLIKEAHNSFPTNLTWK